MMKGLGINTLRKWWIAMFFFSFWLMPIASSAACTATIANYTNVTCYGGSNGSVSLSAASGTAPYRYKNGINGTWQYSNIFSSLIAATDTFYITDTLGCTVSVMTTITQPAQVTASVSISGAHAVCPNTPDTLTAVPVNGGTSPSYQWYENGNAVGNASTYIYPGFVGNDQVQVKMTSSLPCLAGTQVTAHIYTSYLNYPAGVPYNTTGNGCLGRDSLVANPALLAQPATGTIWYLASSPVNYSIVQIDSIPTPTNYAGNDMQGTAANNIIPAALCFDNAGYLYVTDAGNYRVQRFPPGSTAMTNGVTVAGSNSGGSIYNTFSQAWAVFVDRSGYIYVGDNTRVLKFPPTSTSATSGMIVAGANGSGSGLNQMGSVDGLVVDSAGYIYASDALNNRVLKFPPGSDSATLGVVVATGLNSPAGICVDRTGNLYVADFGNSRIQKFAPGNSSGTPIAGGSVSSTLGNTNDVAVDATGNFYVADYSNSVVRKFPPNSTSTTTGVVVAGMNGLGSGGFQLNQPWGVKLDAAGNIYVADYLNNRVEKCPQANIFSYRPTVAGSYTLSYITTGGCNSGNSGTAVITPSDTAYVTITGRAAIQCGAADTFTATAVHGGTTPIYQWYRNGIAVGTNSPTFISNTLSNNDSVWATMATSASACTQPVIAVSNKIHIISGTPITPAVTISAVRTYICALTPDTFTATPVNGGNPPVYQWYKNGITVGTNARIYTTGSLVNNDSVWVVMTSSAACAVPLTATSAKIRFSTTTPLPGVSIYAAHSTTCAGAPDSITALLSNPGSSAAYQWYKNGTPTGNNSPLYVTSTLATNDSVWVVATSNICGTIYHDTSAHLHITITPSVTPRVSVLPISSICNGSAIVFPASNNGGSAPMFSWYKNNVLLGIDTAGFFTISPVTGSDSVWVVMTSSAACANPLTVSSIHNTIPTASFVTPSVTISGNSAICSGRADTFTAMAVNAGSTTIYQWYQNGIMLGGNNPVYIPASINNNDSVWVVVTPFNVCSSPTSATSNHIRVSVGAVLTPSVTIRAAHTALCSAGADTFTAVATNSGNNPSYYWYKNGVAIGTSSSVYTASSLNNNDSVWVVMASSAACVSPASISSNHIVVNIAQAVTPSVIVSAVRSAACIAVADTFTATPLNGGATPVYQWYKNGSAVGTNASVYIGIINTNDSIWAVMTSSAACAVPAAATSNKIHISTGNVIPSVSITGDTSEVCNAYDRFVATPVNGGTAPFYQWYKNGVAVGTDSAGYTTATVVLHDSVWVVMTSNAACASTATATSNKIKITQFSSFSVNIGSNSPVTTGSAINLTASVTLLNCTYAWSGPNGFTSSTQNPTIANATTAMSGTYTVTATNFFGCHVINTVAVTVISPCHIILSTTIKGQTCTSSADTVWVNASGGTAPYKYRLGTTGSYQYSNVFTNLGANTSYTFYVLDTSGCTQFTPAFVPAAMQVTPSVTIAASLMSLCAGRTDTFGATPVNGGAAPTYSWIKNGSAVGVYSPVYITNSLNNNDVVLVNLTSSLLCANPPFASSNQIHVSVSSSSVVVNVQIESTSTVSMINTALMAIPSGGTTPYTYQWSTGGNTVAQGLLPPGTYTVTVRDASGCSASKTVTTEELSGRIHSWNVNSGVRTAGVNEGIQLEITDTSGRFYFPVLQGSVDTITPSKNSDVSRANGVTSQDVLIVQHYIAHTYQIAGPYGLIAADVDGSGTITSSDYTMMQNLILGNITSFPGNRLWAFVPTNYSFPNANTPWNFPRSRIYTAAATQASQPGQDFTGIKLGDVNGDWNPLVAKTNSADSVVLSMPDMTIAPTTQNISVPIRARNFNGISGFQFTLQWDSTILTYSGMDTTHSRLRPDVGTSRDTSGLLSILWTDPNFSSTTIADDSTLFYINYQVIGMHGDSTNIMIDSTLIAVQVTDSNLNSLPVGTSSGKILISNPTGIAAADAGPTVYVHPNPAASKVTITVSVQADISVTDLEGKEVYSKRNVRTADQISTGDWAAGLYIISVRAGAIIKNTKLAIIH
jgi:sugar lactone lactonase YvrE